MSHFNSVQKNLCSIIKNNEGILIPCMFKKQKLLTFGWMRINEQLFLIKPNLKQLPQLE